MESLFKEYKEVFEETQSPKEKKSAFAYAYSPFALQDALGSKDVKKAWIEYQKLRLQGIEADELVYKILSKVKEMLAISRGASKSDLSIQKDYPYDKSKRDVKNWRPQELEDFYDKLVKTYHQVRMVGENLDVSLEKLLLSL